MEGKMSQITEIEAITTIDNTLSKLEDPSTRDRILNWAWEKFYSKTSKPNTLPGVSHESPSEKKRGGKKKWVKSQPSIVKDINLRPDGKKSLKDFAGEKNPKTHMEKCALSVYYLSRVLDITEISINHIYTCYKQMGWKLPDLYNVIALTASRKGWIDTSNMNAISITTIGKNLIEHDLPSSSTSKS
jgi:hypothetical protein